MYLSICFSMLVCVCMHAFVYKCGEMSNNINIDDKLFVQTWDLHFYLLKYMQCTHIHIFIHTHI